MPKAATYRFTDREEDRIRDERESGFSEDDRAKHYGVPVSYIAIAVKRSVEREEYGDPTTPIPTRANTGNQFTTKRANTKAAAVDWAKVDQWEREGWSWHKIMAALGYRSGNTANIKRFEARLDMWRLERELAEAAR